MTYVEQSSASNWPVINAVVQADGNGRLEVAGIEESVSAGSVQEARDEVRERATVYARETLRRPVRLSATDPEGSWDLLVHPDGDVDDLGVDAPTTRRRVRGRAGRRSWSRSVTRVGWRPRPERRPSPRRPAIRLAWRPIAAMLSGEHRRDGVRRS